jgi:hypothetical protein
MDYDRKSTVSSFYGARRNSIDPLHSDPRYGQPPTQRLRNDSASSFYNPNGPSRASVDLASSGFPSSTAGYNRQSYFDAGRVEPVKGGYDEEAAGLRDEPFDIYADFNNAGPKYSTILGTQDTGYRQVPSPGMKAEDDHLNNSNPVEMVTVPALGPEWKASELKEMTKGGKNEVKRERRAQRWKEWRRGERGLCGRYLTKKFLAWFMFILLCMCVSLTV